MSYRNKIKKENFELVRENDDLKSGLRLQAQLFMKHGLLPALATSPCLCVADGKPPSPPCAACAAKDILTEAGWKMPEQKSKSNIIIPDGITTPDKR